MFSALSTFAADSGDEYVSDFDLPKVENPLKTAVFLKHFSTAEKDGIKIIGNAQVGKELKGLEVLKSKRRGGDGEVASFLENSYIIFGEEAKDKNFLGKGGEFTMLLRMRSKWGHWSYPLLKSMNESVLSEMRQILDVAGGFGIRFNYYSEDLKSLLTEKFLDNAFGKRLLENPDFKLNRIGVATNLRGMDGSWWHEIVVRYDGLKLSLFMDGVLLAENYPVSKIINLKAPFIFPSHSYEMGAKKPESSDEEVKLSIAEKFEGGAKSFEGDLDTFAIWNRALGMDEIYFLSESKRASDLLKMDYIGSDADCFYLMDSKTPLTGFTAPTGVYFKNALNIYLALEKYAPLDKWGMSGITYKNFCIDEIGIISTGSTIIDMEDKFDCGFDGADAVYANDKVYIFYNDRGVLGEFKGEKYPEQNIWCSVSSDGKIFKKLPTPCIKNISGYFSAHYDAKDKVCRIYLINGDIWESADFESWKKLEINWKGKDQKALTWVEVFEMGRYYYLMGNRTGELFRSKSFAGPWEAIPSNIIGGLAMPRILVKPSGNYFKDEAPEALMLGIVIRASRSGALMLRRVEQAKNGELLGKLAYDFLPAFRISDTLKLSTPDASRVEGDLKKFSIKALDSTESVRALIGELPKNYTLKITLKLKDLDDKSGADFGIIFNSMLEKSSGMKLNYNLEKSELELADLVVPLQPDAKSKEYPKIKSRPFSSRTLEIEAIRRNGTCDMIINGKDMILATGRLDTEYYLEIYAKKCNIEVVNFEYRPFNEIQSRAELYKKTGLPTNRSRRSR